MHIYKFISQILIAFGILLINLFVFTFLAEYLCKSFYNVNVAQVISSGNFDSFNSNIINAIRIFQGVVSLGSFIFSSFVISYLFKQKPLEYLKLKKFFDLKLLFFIPVVFFVSIPIISWLVQINGELKFPSFMSSFENILQSLESKNNKMYDLMLTMNSTSDLVSNIVIMALIPAIGEELFCRGVLLNIFYGYTGKFYRSVLIVAVIFTVFHLQFYKLIPMVTIAFLLGVFVNWTKGIWASILFHFFNNCFAVIGKYFYNKGYNNLFTNQETNFPLYFVILSFVTSFALFFYLNKIYKK